MRVGYDGDKWVTDGPVPPGWHDASPYPYTFQPSKVEPLLDHCVEKARRAYFVARDKVHASRAMDTSRNLDVSPELYGYQRAGVDWLTHNDKVLLADEMGLGKSPQAIQALNILKPKTALIVCPASLKINWQREFAKWGTVAPEIIKPGGKAAPFSIINYDILHRTPDLYKRRWDAVVMDEVHYAKTPTAIRTRQCFKLAKSCEVLFELTGTPMDRPMELWTLLHMLDPERWPDFHSFAHRYCNPQLMTVYTKGGKKKVWDYTGHANLDELNEILRSRYMIRRLKKNVLPQLPPKTRQVVFLDQIGMGKYLRAEKSAWDGMVSDLGYREAAARMQSNQLVEFEDMARARVALGKAKVKSCVAHLKDVLESERKIVVFAHHRAVILDLLDGLKDYNPVCVVGGMADTKKMEAVDTFMQDERCRVFIGNITAAGVGLTLTVARYAAFCELPWSPKELTQAEDRIHRVGQLGNVLIQHLVVDGSLDANQVHKILYKQTVAYAGLDG